MRCRDCVARSALDRATILSGFSRRHGLLGADERLDMGETGEKSPSLYDETDELVEEIKDFPNDTPSTEEIRDAAGEGG